MDATQTLTNKTLTSPTITGTGAIAGTFTGNLTGDVTGNVSGSSGSTTGNAATATQIVGIANADIVQKEAEQTLTNKTLTSPTITGTGAIAGTFTGNLTGDVTGNVTGNVSGSSGSTTGNAATATQIVGIANDDIVQLDATQTLTNKTLTSPTITGTGAIAGTFTGNVTGDVTGNLTGDVTGDVYASDGLSKILESGTDGTDAIFTGDVTGNLTGDVTGNVSGSSGSTTGNAATATQIVGIANADIVQLDANTNINQQNINVSNYYWNWRYCRSFYRKSNGRCNRKRKWIVWFDNW